jgi:hypothetical protein
MSDRPLCKVAIGSAYQRPLRRDWTPEEYWIQRVLLRKPREYHHGPLIAIYALLVALAGIWMVVP